MRYAIVAALCLILALPFWLEGQSTKTLTGMTEATTFSASNILDIVLDPGGSPLSRKITAANLLRRSRSCEVVFGNPNATAVLADGDNAPVNLRERERCGSDNYRSGVLCRCGIHRP